MFQFHHKKPNKLFLTPNCNPYICTSLKFSNEIAMIPNHKWKSRMAIPYSAKKQIVSSYENIIQLVKTIHQNRLEVR